MSIRKNIPKITVARVLLVVSLAVLLVVFFSFFGTNEWVSGISAGVAVFVGSFLGTRWRDQDATKKRAEERFLRKNLLQKSATQKSSIAWNDRVGFDI